jgi:hypothetical protein
MKRRLPQIWFALPLFAAVVFGAENRPTFLPAAVSGHPVTALVSRVLGTARRYSSPQAPIEPFEILSGGETLRVDQGYVLLICSTDHVVRVSGPKTWQLSADRCRADGTLVQGIYAIVSPRLDGSSALGGAAVIEAGVRNHQGVDEILLAPRNTAVATPRPKLLWRQITGATQYQIEVPGLGGAIWLPAAEVACGAHADWPGIQVCESAFPAGLSNLQVGQVVYPMIGYLRGLSGLPIQESYKGAVQLLPPSEIQSIDRRIAALSGLPGGQREALTGDLYSAAGLRAAAIEAYRRSLAVESAPESRVQLGRLYIETELPSFAAKELRAALAAPLSTESVKAAASWFLAQLAYSGEEFEEAEALALQAAVLFQRLNWKEGEAAAKSLATHPRERKGFPPRFANPNGAS